MSRDTKEALLDAAEELFERHGVAATSVRAVTDSASANIAAINYHFGGKDGLIRAVLQRRLEPLNAERLRQLDALESQGQPSLEAVLAALLQPAVFSAGGMEVFLRFLGRLHFEADATLNALIEERFAEVAGRFSRALHRCTPHLPIDEVLWRLHFTVGSMAAAIANPGSLKRLARDLGISTDPEDVLRQLVVFLAAGFRAPATGGAHQPGQQGPRQTNASRIVLSEPQTGPQPEPTARRTK